MALHGVPFFHDSRFFRMEIFQSIAEALSGIYGPARVVRDVIMTVVSAFNFHTLFYWAVGVFFTRKFPKAKKNHKYAICIPARNEEDVIGNLIKSIKRQDYPSELITIFVVADNCTDSTARIASELGAVVYEHNNPAERTKGFALKYLFERISEDFGIKAFEGYFVFDSDNLLNRDYITRMNESFDAGEKIITSYRNTKNFDECWLSSTYALHWLRSIRYRHRARSLFHLATNIQGTGFLFANELVENGWPYTSLTEDRAFTADAVAHGYKISYNDTAEFFDEQPVSVKIAIRQRIRWAKGHLQAFVQTGPLLFTNIFLGNQFAPKKPKGEKYTRAEVLESIRHRWASFDTLGQLIPTSIISLILWILVAVLIGMCEYYSNGILDTRLIGGGNWLSRFLRFFVGDVRINMSPGLSAMWTGLVLTVSARIIMRLAGDLKKIPVGVYIFFMERKRIKPIKLYKKALYCLTWPIFDLVGRYAMYFALFMRVEWKPIPHKSKVTIEDIETDKTGPAK